ncbi:MAG: discoidin domain-containing protein [Armatimonadetes bacterium]|nr:discoidin domain-containing protein [Armatimonadota bacterium]
MLQFLLPLVLAGAIGVSQNAAPKNLALSAKASAFEFYGDYRPERANDGNPNTRWSGIPGHNVGAWYQLDWPTAVKVAEVVVHQYGTYTEELDVQVWDDAKGDWRTLQHFGEKGQRLRGIVICRFEPVMTPKVRLGNITNGPTFREVEVYSEPYAAGKPEIHAASDLQGNIVGIVTDGWGAEPHLGSVEVRMVGRVEVRKTVQTDSNGMFSVPMPVGMKGKVKFNFTPVAADLQPASGSSVAAGSVPASKGFAPVAAGLQPASGSSVAAGSVPASKGFAPVAADLQPASGGSVAAGSVPASKGFAPVAAGSVPAQSATAEIDAANFQYGLTELGYKPKVTLLDGTWKFMGDPPKGFEKPGFDDSKWKDIQVPAHWEMEGFVVRSGHGGYRVRFQAPNSPSPGSQGSPTSPFPTSQKSEARGEVKMRTKIRFEGVYSGCEVYCNGVLVARHIGGATPFEADLTDALKPGENVLALDVQEHTVASDHLDKMSIYAYFHLAGIWRSVKLFQVPEVHIRDFEWRVEDWGEKRAFVNVDIANESSREVTCLLEHELTDMKGEQLALTPGLGDRGMVFTPGLSIDALSCQRKNLRAAVRNPKLWTAETPNLYNLKLTLKDDKGKVLQTVTQRVGFRQTEVKGTEILINGTPVKFRGTCHHDQHPLKGRAVSEADTRRDLEMMKEANLNAVRTSHYPPHPSLPEIADELGLYVEDEAPFCWADASDDLRNAPLILQHTAELIARDRNHASVAWWSMANESGYGWGFWRALEWAKKADPSRPASAATSAQPGDEVGRSTAKLDIYTLHNPLALSRIQDAEGKMKAPLIFDESLCIFQGIWNDVAEMWVDPGIRDYYVEPYKEVMAAFEKSKVTQGSFIWAWSDDLFCVPNRGLEYGREATRSHFVEPLYSFKDRGIVGDAPWGVVDGWRSPKPETWHIRMLYEPTKILGVERVAFEGTEQNLALRIRNDNDFLTIQGAVYHLQSNKLSQGFRIGVGAIPPRSEGLIVFPRSGDLQDSDKWSITPQVSRSKWTDYSVPNAVAWGPKSSEEPTAKPILSGPLSIFESGDLGGNTVTLSGERFEIAFSRDVGLLRRCTLNGSPFLTELPLLHLLPTGAPLKPMPAQETWKFKGIAVTKNERNVKVHVAGSYDAFEGSYDYLITPEGEITCQSEFTYQGEDRWFREIGQRFSVRLQDTMIRWKRDAEWDIYPSNHIGRATGDASSLSQSIYPMDKREGRDPEVGAGGMSAHNAYGLVDFRSTKRHIRWAKVWSFDMGGAEILSDGSQHLRAMVETDRISVHVNDFYGGTGAGLWEWELNYGKGRLLKKGDKVHSTLKLRLVP